MLAFRTSAAALRTYRWCVAVSVLVLSLPVTARQEAAAALARGDFAAAFSAFLARAEQGDPISQNNVGVLYLKGRGTRRDYGSARVWFERAAASGLPGAKHNLGIMHLRGYGMSRDAETAARLLGEAAEAGDREAQFFSGLLRYRGTGLAQDLPGARQWFSRAADQGLAAAAYNLAVMQLQGEGGPPDESAALATLDRIQHEHPDAALLLGRIELARDASPNGAARAAALFRPLAEGGNPAAQFHLGMMLLMGRGLERDEEEGRFWLQQASRLGYPAAQLNLGNVYANGVGVTRDPVQALAWYTLAATNGERAADAGRDALRATLSAPELAQAEQLVATLRERHAAAVLPASEATTGAMPP